MNIKIAIIGAGPAGLGAALSAHESGIKPENIHLIERDIELGGILPQCIHNGFGKFIFGERMTGPEYANHYIEKIKETGINYHLNTMALDINQNRIITAVNPEKGLMRMNADSVILAMGCRERTRYQIRLPGDRPSGIYPAGTVQRLINIEGVLPGEKAVILGSGDIGMIMARRLVLEGAEVEGVYEIMSSPSGLPRNVQQCLRDYDIPFYLNHTVTNIHGDRRLEGVTVAEIDPKNFQPKPETERRIECDTLVLSVGLIPENELSEEVGITLDERTGGPLVDEERETSVDGIFGCGNVVHVYDLVDDVTKSAELAGRSAARFVKEETEKRENKLSIKAGENVAYTVPQNICKENDESVEVFFRVEREKQDAKLEAVIGNEVIIEEKAKRVVKPPIMEKLTLSRDSLPENGEILIRVGERE